MRALALIGAAFIVLTLLGAVVPGWNFHVIFANDKSALDWHASRVVELAKRIEAKEQPHDPR